MNASKRKNKKNIYKNTNKMITNRNDINAPPIIGIIIVINIFLLLINKQKTIKFRRVALHQMELLNHSLINLIDIQFFLEERINTINK